ncbi:putative RING finger protein [Smittium culicis]|uniref:Putative RING finger protein n=1 Tax=Smittium culicis TaxID=133412 RepID=A0A1R1YRT6_9FUNG|nr:putative RING finger protein [Smittium culicis]
MDSFPKKSKKHSLLPGKRRSSSSPYHHTIFSEQFFYSKKSSLFTYELQDSLSSFSENLDSKYNDTDLNSNVEPVSIHGFNSSIPFINLNSHYYSFVCKKCRHSSVFTQSILFKAISNSIYKCENCGIEGLFEKKSIILNENVTSHSIDDIQISYFIPEFLDPNSVDSYFFRLIPTLEKLKHTNICLFIGNFEKTENNLSISKKFISVADKVINISYAVNNIDNSIKNTKKFASINKDISVADKSMSFNKIGLPSEASSKKSFKGKRKEKVVMNHLLNFSLTPRVINQAPILKRSHAKNSQPFYEREVFVNSNFRFMLKNKQFDTKILTNPDFKPDWDDVEQVIVPSNDSLSCPICLEKLTAPRVTRCGHVYCLVCLLRLLSESEQKIQKCPVCWVLVEESQVKRAYLWETIDLPLSKESKSTLEMRLMLRKSASCFSYPVDSDYWNLANLIPSGSSNLPLSDIDADVECFSRLMICSNSTMIKSLKHEISDLETLRNDSISDNDEITKTFLDLALDKVKIEFSSFEKIFKNEKNAEDNSYSLENSKEKQEMLHLAQEDLEKKGKFKMSSSVKKIVADNHHIFYQSSDGQHIFLSQLDLRILKDSYKNSIDLMPKRINLQVDFMSRIDVTVEYRRKNKIFDHLPLRCDMIIVEADLSGVVDSDTINDYGKKLKLRRNHHLDQLKREAKDDERASMNLKSQEIRDMVSNSAHPYHPYLHEYIGSESNNYLEGERMYSMLGSTQHALLNVIGVKELESEFPTLSVEAHERNGSLTQCGSNDSDSFRGKNGFQTSAKSSSRDQDLELKNEPKPKFNNASKNGEYLPAKPKDAVWGSYDSKKSLSSIVKNNGMAHNSISSRGYMNHSADISRMSFVNESARLKSLDDVWSKLEIQSSSKQSKQNSNSSKKKKKQMSGIKLAVTGSINYNRK